MGKNAQNDFDWDNLRILCVLADEGSLAGAARVLGIEHSTVARRLDRLEAALGLRLFDRLARGWRATEEAGPLIERARSVRNEVRRFRRSASDFDELAGEVRISAPPLIMKYLVLDIVTDLQSAHPQLRFALSSERRQADIGSAEADIALRMVRPTDDTLIIRSLRKVRYSLYGTRRMIESPSHQRRYAGFDEEMRSLPQRSWLENNVPSDAVVTRSNDLAIILAAVKSGMAMALLPDFAASHHSGISADPENSRVIEVPLFLVMHPDTRRSKRNRLVSDALAQNLAN